MVFDVAREVHGAGAVHGAMNLHVAVDDVEVFLLILEQTAGEKRAGAFSFLIGYDFLGVSLLK